MASDVDYKLRRSNQLLGLGLGADPEPGAFIAFAVAKSAIAVSRSNLPNALSVLDLLEIEAAVSWIVKPKAIVPVGLGLNALGELVEEIPKRG